LNSIYKIIFIALSIVIIIVTGVIISMSILKEEAIKSHLQVSKLQVNTFSEQLSQTFNSLEHTVDNLSLILEKSHDTQVLDERLVDIIALNPYVRSINILDENQKILYSSNKQNIGVHVNTNEYYPKPIFDKYILRFGTSQYGRDISQSDAHLIYLPVTKIVSTKKKDYIVLLVINIDNFINRYTDNFSVNLDHFDIVRIDGKLLFSTDKTYQLGETLEEKELYKESLEKGMASGVEDIKEKLYLVSYQLTEIYPLNIAIKLDYYKTLKDWEERKFIILLLLTILVFISILLVVIILIKHETSRNRESEYQKSQIQNQRKFKIIFEQNNFLAAILDTNGTIIEMNSIYMNFLKESDSSIIGSKFYELSCWENENKKWIEENIKEYRKDSYIEGEVVVKDKENKNHFIDLTITSIESNGNIELVIIGKDTTEDRLKEDRIKNAYTVFDNTNDGIVITNKDAKILDVNKAFTINTGYTLDEVKGKNPNILKSNRDDNNFYKKMWKSIEKNNFWHGEIINKQKNGSLYVELLTINRILDSDGKVKNYIGVFTNITKQKTQDKLLKDKEQILFQQSKMASMGEMLENIAHQWRQPLSVISTAASGIKMQKEFNILDEKVMDESLELIVSSTQHLSNTIDDFRNFFRPDKEKLEFSINNVIDKSLNIVSSKFKNRSINIIRELYDIHVVGYENELVQVIMNILNNSKDALEQKELNERHILIKTYQDDKNAIITIQDSGGGIKIDIINKIFEPYFTTKHQAQGTGIGLYMSAEIVSKHMCGKLDVKNTMLEHDGKHYVGACFTISIPFVLE